MGLPNGSILPERQPVYSPGRQQTGVNLFGNEAAQDVDNGPLGVLTRRPGPSVGGAAVDGGFFGLWCGSGRVRPGLADPSLMLGLTRPEWVNVSMVWSRNRRFKCAKLVVRTFNSPGFDLSSKSVKEMFYLGGHSPANADPR